VLGYSFVRAAASNVVWSYSADLLQQLKPAFSGHVHTVKGITQAHNSLVVSFDEGGRVCAWNGNTGVQFWRFHSESVVERVLVVHEIVVVVQEAKLLFLDIRDGAQVQGPNPPWHGGIGAAVYLPQQHALAVLSGKDKLLTLLRSTPFDPHGPSEPVAITWNLDKHRSNTDKTGTSPVGSPATSPRSMDRSASSESDLGTPVRPDEYDRWQAAQLDMPCSIVRGTDMNASDNEEEESLLGPHVPNRTETLVDVVQHRLRCQPVALFSKSTASDKSTARQSAKVQLQLSKDEDVLLVISGRHVLALDTNLLFDDALVSQQRLPCVFNSSSLLGWGRGVVVGAAWEANVLVVGFSCGHVSGWRLQHPGDAFDETTGAPIPMSVPAGPVAEPRALRVWHSRARDCHHATVVGFACAASMAVTCALDGSVHAWDVASGRLAWRHTCPPQLTSVHMSDVVPELGRRHVLAVSRTGLVRVFVPATGLPTATFQCDNLKCGTLCVQPNAVFVSRQLTGGVDGFVSDHGRLRHVWSTHDAFRGGAAETSGHVMVATCERLFVGDGTRLCCLLVAGGHPVWTSCAIDNHERDILAAVALDPGVASAVSHVVVTTDGVDVRGWDQASGALLWVTPATGVRRLVCSKAPCVIGCPRAGLVCWRADTGALAWSHHSSSSVDILHASDTTVTVMLRASVEVVVHDSQTGRVLHTTTDGSPTGQLPQRGVGTRVVDAAASSQCLVVSFGTDGTFVLHRPPDVRGPRKWVRVAPSLGEVSCVATKGSVAYAVLADGSVAALQFPGGKLVARTEAVFPGCRSAKVVGSQLVMATTKGVATLDLEKLHRLRTEVIHLYDQEGGELDYRLAQHLPVFGIFQEVLVVLIQAAQLVKFSFSEATPPALQPLSETLGTLSSFGLPRVSFWMMQVVVYILLAWILAILTKLERIETWAVKRPSSKAASIMWLVAQQTLSFGTRALFLPMVEILAVPWDCTSIDGSLRVDADNSVACWSEAMHVVVALLGLVAGGLFLWISLRLQLAGGAPENFSFEWSRLLSRRLDRFVPKHVHPMSIDHVRYRLINIAAKLVLVLATLFLTTKVVVVAAIAVASGLVLLWAGVFHPQYMPATGRLRAKVDSMNARERFRRITVNQLRVLLDAGIFWTYCCGLAFAIVHEAGAEPSGVVTLLPAVMLVVIVAAACWAAVRCRRQSKEWMAQRSHRASPASILPHSSSTQVLLRANMESKEHMTAGAEVAAPQMHKRGQDTLALYGAWTLPGPKSTRYETAGGANRFSTAVYKSRPVIRCSSGDLAGSAVVFRVGGRGKVVVGVCSEHFEQAVCKQHEGVSGAQATLFAGDASRAGWFSDGPGGWGMDATSGHVHHWGLETPLRVVLPSLEGVHEVKLEGDVSGRFPSVRLSVDGQSLGRVLVDLPECMGNLWAAVAMTDTRFLENVPVPLLQSPSAHHHAADGDTEPQAPVMTEEEASEYWQAVGLLHSEKFDTDSDTDDDATPATTTFSYVNTACQVIGGPAVLTKAQSRAMSARSFKSGLGIVGSLVAAPPLACSALDMECFGVALIDSSPDEGSRGRRARQQRRRDVAANGQTGYLLRQRFKVERCQAGLMYLGVVQKEPDRGDYGRKLPGRRYVAEFPRARAVWFAADGSLEVLGTWAESPSQMNNASQRAGFEEGSTVEVLVKGIGSASLGIEFRVDGHSQVDCIIRYHQDIEWITGIVVVTPLDRVRLLGPVNASSSKSASHDRFSAPDYEFNDLVIPPRPDHDLLPDPSNPHDVALALRKLSEVASSGTVNVRRLGAWLRLPPQHSVLVARALRLLSTLIRKLGNRFDNAFWLADTIEEALLRHVRHNSPVVLLAALELLSHMANSPYAFNLLGSPPRGAIGSMTRTVVKTAVACCAFQHCNPAAFAMLLSMFQSLHGPIDPLLAFLSKRKLEAMSADTEVDLGRATTMFSCSSSLEGSPATALRPFRGLCFAALRSVLSSKLGADGDAVLHDLHERLVVLAKHWLKPTSAITPLSFPLALLLAVSELKSAATSLRDTPTRFVERRSAWLPPMVSNNGIAAWHVYSSFLRACWHLQTCVGREHAKYGNDAFRLIASSSSFGDEHRFDGLLSLTLTATFPATQDGLVGFICANHQLPSLPWSSKLHDVVVHSWRGTVSTDVLGRVESGIGRIPADVLKTLAELLGHAAPQCVELARAAFLSSASHVWSQLHVNTQARALTAILETGITKPSFVALDMMTKLARTFARDGHEHETWYSPHHETWRALLTFLLQRLRSNMEHVPVAVCVQVISDCHPTRRAAVLDSVAAVIHESPSAFTTSFVKFLMQRRLPKASRFDAAVRAILPLLGDALSSPTVPAEARLQNRNLKVMRSRAPFVKKNKIPKTGSDDTGDDTVSGLPPLALLVIAKSVEHALCSTFLACVAWLHAELKPRWPSAWVMLSELQQALGLGQGWAAVVSTMVLTTLGDPESRALVMRCSVLPEAIPELPSLLHDLVGMSQEAEHPGADESKEDNADTDVGDATTHAGDVSFIKWLRSVATFEVTDVPTCMAPLAELCAWLDASSDWTPLWQLLVRSPDCAHFWLPGLLGTTEQLALDNPRRCPTQCLRRFAQQLASLITPSGSDRLPASMFPLCWSNASLDTPERHACSLALALFEHASVAGAIADAFADVSQLQRFGPADEVVRLGLHIPTAKFTQARPSSRDGVLSFGALSKFHPAAVRLRQHGDVSSTTQRTTGHPAIDEDCAMIMEACEGLLGRIKPDMKWADSQRSSEFGWSLARTLFQRVWSAPWTEVSNKLHDQTLCLRMWTECGRPTSPALLLTLMQQLVHTLPEFIPPTGTLANVFRSIIECTQRVGVSESVVEQAAALIAWLEQPGVSLEPLQEQYLVAIGFAVLGTRGLRQGDLLLQQQFEQTWSRLVPRLAMAGPLQHNVQTFAALLAIVSPLQKGFSSAHSTALVDAVGQSTLRDALGPLVTQRLSEQASVEQELQEDITDSDTVLQRWVVACASEGRVVPMQPMPQDVCIWSLPSPHVTWIWAQALQDSGGGSASVVADLVKVSGRKPADFVADATPVVLHGEPAARNSEWDELCRRAGALVDGDYAMWEQLCCADWPCTPHLAPLAGHCCSDQVLHSLARRAVSVVKTHVETLRRGCEDVRAHVAQQLEAASHASDAHQDGAPGLTEAQTELEPATAEPSRQLPAIAAVDESVPRLFDWLWVTKHCFVNDDSPPRWLSDLHTASKVVEEEASKLQADVSSSAVTQTLSREALRAVKSATKAIPPTTDVITGLSTSAGGVVPLMRTLRTLALAANEDRITPVSIVDFVQRITSRSRKPWFNPTRCLPAEAVDALSSPSVVQALGAAMVPSIELKDRPGGIPYDACASLPLLFAYAIHPDVSAAEWLRVLPSFLPRIQTLFDAATDTRGRGEARIFHSMLLSSVLMVISPHLAQLPNPRELLPHTAHLVSGCEHRELGLLSFTVLTKLWNSGVVRTVPREQQNKLLEWLVIRYPPKWIVPLVFLLVPVPRLLQELPALITKCENKHSKRAAAAGLARLRGTSLYHRFILDSQQQRQQQGAEHAALDGTAGSSLRALTQRSTPAARMAAAMSEIETVSHTDNPEVLQSTLRTTWPRLMPLEQFTEMCISVSRERCRSWQQALLRVLPRASHLDKNRQFVAEAEEAALLDLVLATTMAELAPASGVDTRRVADLLGMDTPARQEDVASWRSEMVQLASCVRTLQLLMQAGVPGYHAHATVFKRVVIEPARVHLGFGFVAGMRARSTLVLDNPDVFEALARQVSSCMPPRVGGGSLRDLFLPESHEDEPSHLTRVRGIRVARVLYGCLRSVYDACCAFAQESPPSRVPASHMFHSRFTGKAPAMDQASCVSPVRIHCPCFAAGASALCARNALLFGCLRVCVSACPVVPVFTCDRTTPQSCDCWTP